MKKHSKEKKDDKRKQTKKIKTEAPSNTKAKKDESVNFEDMYKRALADYQNLLKQGAKERRDFVKYANEQLFHQLIPVYDNLKISLNHTDKETEESAWGQGVKYVLKQFSGILSDNGIEEIKTIGEKFDHNTMEAIEGKGEKVSKELRPGYKLNDKVIIPAKVEVGE